VSVGSGFGATSTVRMRSLFWRATQFCAAKMAPAPKSSASAIMMMVLERTERNPADLLQACPPGDGAGAVKHR
jgi:hypothetical protein